MHIRWTAALLVGLGAALAAPVRAQPVAQTSGDALPGCGSGLSTVATVQRFYALIDGRDFTRAFQCFSGHRQAALTFAGWRAGYATTLHTKLKGVPLTLSPTVVRFALLATDAVSGHRVYSRFSGSWSLVSERGGWRLDAAHVSMLSRAQGPSLVFIDRLLHDAATYSGGVNPFLPAYLPSGPFKAWHIESIDQGIYVVLAQGEPIVEANTYFTELASAASQPSGLVDRTVTLTNGSTASFYDPGAHGGNGRAVLTWNAGLNYAITYACPSNCLVTMKNIANTMAPIQS